MVFKPSCEVSKDMLSGVGVLQGDDGTGLCGELQVVRLPHIYNVTWISREPISLGTRKGYF